MNMSMHQEEKSLYDRLNNKSHYEKAVEEMLRDCESLLKSKHQEYASNGEDYHNFRLAAELQCVTLPQALIGMMDKHVVSVHDLVIDHAEGRDIPLELWQEKIRDNINYLLILWAMVNEG